MSQRLEDAGTMVPGRSDIPISRRDLLALGAGAVIAGAPGVAAAAGPQGQLTWGIHVSLAPTWFDPAETSGLITPFMVLYALQDAVHDSASDGASGFPGIGFTIASCSA